MNLKSETEKLKLAKVQVDEKSFKKEKECL